MKSNFWYCGENEIKEEKESESSSSFDYRSPLGKSQSSVSGKASSKVVAGGKDSHTLEF